MSRLQIRVISISTIKPEPQINSTIKTYLTPWDLELMHQEYDQHGLLFRTNPNATARSSSSSSAMIDRLKSSLGRALHFFPLLSGRLVTATSSDRDSSSTCFHFECDENTVGGGVPFIHAASQNPNVTVSDLLLSYALENMQALYPMHGALSHEGVSKPLFGVQVTQLVDGFFVGWSYNQMLGDGISFFNHFLNAWAEISRGGDGKLTTPSKLPFQKRERLTLDLTGSKRIYIDNKHLEVVDDVRYSSQLSSDLKSRVFHFKKESVSRLKSRSNQQITAMKTISSLQATIAHVWRSIIRCRFAIDESIIHETTTFEVTMDARNRLSPPLPQGYFGNATFIALVTLQASEILRNGLGWTALEIKKMVDSWNEPNRVEKLFMEWIENPSFLNLNDLPKNHFVLIGSPWLNVYGHDFGWGTPLALRSGMGNAFDGRITVTGGNQQGGVTHVDMCLDSKTLCALEKDREFMEFVSMDWSNDDNKVLCNNLVDIRSAL